MKSQLYRVFLCITAVVLVTILVYALKEKRVIVYSGHTDTGLFGTGWITNVKENFFEQGAFSPKSLSTTVTSSNFSGLEMDKGKEKNGKHVVKSEGTVAANKIIINKKNSTGKLIEVPPVEFFPMTVPGRFFCGGVWGLIFLYVLCDTDELGRIHADSKAENAGWMPNTSTNLKATMTSESSSKEDDDRDGYLDVDRSSWQPIQTQQANATSHILLLTYLRSGSTWLGDITKQANNSFYVFEPFQGIIKQGYYANNTVCFNNNTCRLPRHDNETNEFAFNVLRHLYSCDFRNLPGNILRNVLKPRFQLCLPNPAAELKRTRTGFKGEIRQKLSLEECVLQMTKKCFQADFRIVKTIRLSMELVKSLMENISNLKVIHLVRDPRAITNSRLRGRYTMTHKDESHSRNLCNRMFFDVELGGTLRQKAQDRFTLVMYESMAERPTEGARYVFNFMNATFTERVQNWVYKSSHGNFSGFYTTTRNSSAALSHWRSELPFSRVAIIQNNCKDIFNKLGYVPFKDEKEMLNFDLKAHVAAYKNG